MKTFLYKHNTKRQLSNLRIKTCKGSENINVNTHILSMYVWCEIRSNSVNYRNINLVHLKEVIDKILVM